MKYLLLALSSLSVLTACTVVNEPYGPPRAEVYRYNEPAQYHRHHRGYARGDHPVTQGYPVTRYDNGAVRPRQQAGAVHGQGQVVVPRNAQGQGQVVVPQNAHGRGQAVVPQNVHGHGQVVVPQNVRGRGQVVVPQNTHGHASQVPSSSVQQHPSENVNQTPGAVVTGHN